MHVSLIINNSRIINYKNSYFLNKSSRNQICVVGLWLKCGLVALENLDHLDDD
jgi:hypothetical protein